jgi:hypothetical protein
MDILAFIRDEIINVDISLADADAVCGVSRRQTLRRRDRLIETPHRLRGCAQKALGYFSDFLVCPALSTRKKTPAR